LRSDAAAKLAELERVVARFERDAFDNRAGFHSREELRRRPVRYDPWRAAGRRLGRAASIAKHAGATSAAVTRGPIRSVARWVWDGLIELAVGLSLTGAAMTVLVLAILILAKPD
jgi:hypothetical protein